MKRLLTLAAMFLCCMATTFAQYNGARENIKIDPSVHSVELSAEPVSEQQALEKAQQFMKSKKIKGNKGNLKMHRAHAKNTSHDKVPFYVFNAEDNKGFVIVSGDNRTEEILGYSDEGHIDLDNIPDNLRYWLDDYRKQIEALGNIIVDNRIKSKSRTAIKPLIQTKWTQDDPYNRMTPLNIYGNHSATGCVPTAFAQVMYYYKWPLAVTSEIPGYSDMETLEPTTFDWDKMLTQYTSESDEECCNAVAKLMRYCGQAFHALYGPTGTGANFAESTYEMTRYFSYSKNAHCISRNNYSTDDWEAIIYNELYENRPVVMAGGGHAFICDGYRDDGFFHINWGWGGSFGYFRLSILNQIPSNIIRGYDDVFLPVIFAINQTAVIGLQPSSDEDEVFNEYEYNNSLINYKDHYSRLSVEDNFEIEFVGGKYVFSESELLFTGELGIAVYSGQELIQIIPYNYEDDSRVTSGRGITGKVSFGAGITTGDFIFKTVYRYNGGEWIEPSFPLISVGIIDNLDISFTIKEKFDINARINSFILETPLVVNKDCAVKLNVTNIGKGHELPIYMKIDNQTVGRTTVFLEPGETGDTYLCFKTNSIGKKKIELTSGSNNDAVIYETELEFYPNHYFYSNEVRILDYGDATLPVYLNSGSLKYDDYQFVISLPEGISFNKDDNGVVITDQSDWIVSSQKMAEDRYLFTLSKKNESFSIDEKKPIFRLGIINSTNQMGKYHAYIEDVIGTTSEGNKDNLSPCQINIVVTKTKEIHVGEAGTLSNYITDEERYLIGKLKLSGYLNSRDFILLRDMAGNNEIGKPTNGRLSKIDFSKVNIVADEEYYLHTSRISDDWTNMTQNYVMNGNYYCNIPTNNIFPKYVFAGSNLNSVILPESANSVEEGCFHSSVSLSSVKIPNGISEINRCAFLNCSHLYDITIPSSVKSIGSQAFDYCPNLSYVISSSPTPPIVSNTLSRVTSDAILVVPKGSKEEYTNTSGWNNFSNIEEKDFIIVKADNIKIKKGEEKPAFTYTVEGGELEGEPNIICEVDSNTPGVYTIELRQGTVLNEYVIFKNGLLTVRNDISGDVTGEGSVDVQDATIVVNYILGEKYDEYDYTVADINTDGVVDVFDVAQIINIILSNNYSATSSNHTRSSYVLEDILLMSDDNGLLFGVGDAERFTSFQFDLEVPKGVSIAGVDWYQTTNHTLRFAKIGDNRYRVVALSMASKLLPSKGGSLIRLQLLGSACDEVHFYNILFVTPQGKTIHFNEGRMSVPTVIQGITHPSEKEIYDLSGRRLNIKHEQLSKGIYIINNKLVIK